MCLSMWHSTESRWSFLMWLMKMEIKPDRWKNAVLHIEMEHCIQRYTSGLYVRIGRVVMIYSFRNEVNVKIRTRERMTFLLQGMSVPGMNWWKVHCERWKKNLEFMQEKISFSLSEHTEDSLKLNFMENHSVTMNAVPYIFIENQWTLKSWNYRNLKWKKWSGWISKNAGRVLWMVPCRTAFMKENSRW